MLPTRETDSILPSSALPMRLAQGPTFLPFLLILFVGSGCSALIYEIVWFQLLEFAVGSSAVSLGVLLGTFMGGLCLGSLLFSRVVPRRWHPLRMYALLELGIGVLGLLITWAMPWFDHFYATIAHGAASGVPLRALVCGMCLLPPTLLMGATLPAISRWIETTPKGVSWLGFFYGGNTVGAVVGCLLAGFYLLRHFDMSTSTYVAATLNLVVALLGIAISMGAPHAAAGAAAPAREAGEADGLPPRSGGALAYSTASIYVTIALSGAAALGAEVIWTRLLSLLLGATVYTFSIILAVFLVGLGAGSSVGAMMTRSGINARQALAWCQALCVIGIAWAAYSVTNGLPHWPINSDMAVSNGFRFQLDLARCAWAILPATLFWGASFPLALAAVVGNQPGRDPAKAVGRVYAANTLGAIAGAMYFSLFAVKHFGTQGSQHLLIGLAGLAAVIAIVPGFFPERGLFDGDWMKATTQSVVTLAAAVAIAISCLAVLLRYQLDAVPWELVAWGRRMPTLQLDRTKANYDPTEKLYMGEGMTSSVAVTRDPSTNPPAMQFHVAGKVEASTLTVDMRLQLMLGHFPALFHRPPADPKKGYKVLIVGCGAGVTAGSFMLHPHEEIVICEIEPLVPQVVATYFHEQNNSIVTRDAQGNLPEKVRIVNDDARHFILTTDEKFDIITSDPIHPWVKGAACLYTREYFDLVKKHLNPGGIVTQWVPLYESNTEVVKSEVKTFFEAFPNGSVWLNNDEAGGGYDSILMGSDEPLVIDSAELQKRMDNVFIAGVLGDVRLRTSADVFATYGGSAQDLQGWTQSGETNHDSNLRLQYLAGEALNSYAATAIRDQMLSYRTFPEKMIKGTGEERQMLERMWGISK